MIQAVKALSVPLRVALALAVAALVGCLAMAVGPARGALTYFTDDYEAEIRQSHIGVALIERTGAEEAWRVVDAAGAMLPANALLGDGEGIVPGTRYDERISARNESPDTAEYVRLTVRRYWAVAEAGGDAQKSGALDPRLIELEYDAQSAGDWAFSAAESTDERLVFYLKRALAPGADAPSPAVTGLTVSADVLAAAEDYAGAWAAIDAQVDSVQMGNAVQAAKSAWGVDVTQLGALGLDWSAEE